MNREVHRIIFIRTDRMGDVLMNLPAIRSLRQAYPKAWITLLADNSVAELLRDHPDLDEVMNMDGNEFSRNRTYRGHLKATVKKARFDLGVVSNPQKDLHSLLFFAGVPVRVGWNRKQSFFLNRKLLAPDAIRHEIDKNLELAAIAGGAAWDGKISIPVAAHAALNIEKWMEETQGAGVVAVHAGTSNPEKKWPAQYFAALCDRIVLKTGMRAVLIGGPEEKMVSAQTARFAVTKPLDWTGRFSLKELAAFFSHPQVRALVSVDSGPAHVAWMSGKPAVILFAKNSPGSDPARWGPRDNGRSQIVFKNITEIGVDEVFLALERALSKAGNP